MDIHDKAIELCNKLSNSIYDRDPKSEKPFFFSKSEIELVEDFLIAFKAEPIQYVKPAIGATTAAY
jgi:hypothetical protein